MVGMGCTGERIEVYRGIWKMGEQERGTRDGETKRERGKRERESEIEREVDGGR